MADWLVDALAGRIEPGHRKLVVIPQDGGAGPYTPPVESPYVPDRYA
jgi:hypothetical protein